MDFRETGALWGGTTPIPPSGGRRIFDPSVGEKEGKKSSKKRGKGATYRIQITDIDTAVFKREVKGGVTPARLHLSFVRHSES